MPPATASSRGIALVGAARAAAVGHATAASSSSSSSSSRKKRQHEGSSRVQPTMALTAPVNDPGDLVYSSKRGLTHRRPTFPDVQVVEISDDEDDEEDGAADSSDDVVPSRASHQRGPARRAPEPKVAPSQQGKQRFVNKRTLRRASAAAQDTSGDEVDELASGDEDNRRQRNNRDQSDGEEGDEASSKRKKRKSNKGRVVAPDLVSTPPSSGEMGLAAAKRSDAAPAVVTRRSARRGARDASTPPAPALARHTRTRSQASTSRDFVTSDDSDSDAHIVSSKTVKSVAVVPSRGNKATTSGVAGQRPLARRTGPRASAVTSGVKRARSLTDLTHSSSARGGDSGSDHDGDWDGEEGDVLQSLQSDRAEASSSRLTAKQKGKGRARSNTPEVASSSQMAASASLTGSVNGGSNVKQIKGAASRKIPIIASSDSEVEIVITTRAAKPEASASGSVSHSKATDPTPALQAEPAATTNEYPIKPLNIAGELECTICFDIMVKPVNLTCGHTFCESCVAPWLETARDECPGCRVKLAAPPARAYVLDAIIRKYFENLWTSYEEAGDPAKAEDARQARREYEEGAEARKKQAIEDRAKANAGPAGRDPNGARFGQVIEALRGELYHQQAIFLHRHNLGPAPQQPAAPPAPVEPAAPPAPAEPATFEAGGRAARHAGAAGSSSAGANRGRRAHRARSGEAQPAAQAQAEPPAQAAGPVRTQAAAPGAAVGAQGQAVQAPDAETLRIRSAIAVAAHQARMFGENEAYLRVGNSMVRYANALQMARDAGVDLEFLLRG